MNEAALVASLVAAEEILVASDYDGTLSEIAVSSDAARPASGALEAIQALVVCPRVHVALVSGRTREALARQVGTLEGIWRVTEHGAWIEGPSGQQLSPWLDDAARAKLDHLTAAANELADAHEGVRVERKHTSVAVHVRQVADHQRDSAIAALGRWASRAEGQGFTLIDGRQVLEARWPAHSKATGLTAVMAALPPTTHILYAGDDTTDEDAFGFVRSRGGLAVYVASAERPRPRCVVDVLVEGPREWIAMLSDLARLRRSA